MILDGACVCMCLCVCVLSSGKTISATPPIHFNRWIVSIWYEGFEHLTGFLFTELWPYYVDLVPITSATSLTG